MGPREEWPLPSARSIPSSGLSLLLLGAFWLVQCSGARPIYWIIDLLTLAGCAGFGLYLYRSIRNKGEFPGNNRALPVILLLSLWFLLVAIDWYAGRC